MTTIKHCRHCKQPLKEGLRPDVCYCSTACRQAAYRARTAERDQDPVKNLMHAIAQARNLATRLSRAEDAVLDLIERHDLSHIPMAREFLAEIAGPGPDEQGSMEDGEN